MQDYILAGCGVFAAAVVFVLVLRMVRRARRERPSEMDLMEGHEFEYYCAELLKKSGFQEVEVTRGSGGIIKMARQRNMTATVLFLWNVLCAFSSLLILQENLTKRY